MSCLSVHGQTVQLLQWAWPMSLLWERELCLHVAEALRRLTGFTGTGLVSKLRRFGADCNNCGKRMRPWLLNAATTRMSVVQTLNLLTAGLLFAVSDATVPGKLIAPDHQIDRESLLIALMRQVTQLPPSVCSSVCFHSIFGTD